MSRRRNVPVLSALVAIAVGTSCAGTSSMAGTESIAATPARGEVSEREDEGRVPQQVEPTVPDAAAPVCALTATDCSVTDACPSHAVALTPTERWCPVQPPPRDVATVQLVSGMTLAEGRAIVRSGSGDYEWSGAAWVRIVGPAPRWIIGTEEWHLPPSVPIIECEPGRSSCRTGGGRKCARPPDVCRAVRELVLATRGPSRTPITAPNPMALGRTDEGRPRLEPLLGIAGASSDDVWIASQHYLFHWDGLSASSEPQGEDPLVELLADATGVYGRTRAGRRMHVEAGRWQELPAQPGPFLGASVEAPEHSFVRLVWARATGPDAFWGYGAVHAFEGQELASAVVHYEGGRYRTFVGAIPTSTWWSFLPPDGPAVPLAALRLESWAVLVEDAAYAPGVFPFVTIGWQAVRQLRTLPSTGSGASALVASATGLYELEGTRWARHVTGPFDAIDVTDSLQAAATDRALYLRGVDDGWCPALRLERSSPGLAVVQGRVWSASESMLSVTTSDHRTERYELAVEGRAVVVEQLLADGSQLVALVRDAHEQIAVHFDGEHWTATRLGPLRYARMVRSPDGGLSTPNLRYEAGCWSHTEDVGIPLIEAPAGHDIELRAVGTTEVRLEPGWRPEGD